MLSVVLPFKPRPVFGLLSVSLFFSFCLVCSSTPCFFFSFSAAGETQTFVVWFSRMFRGHDLLLQPVPRGRHLHQGLHPVVFLRRCRLSFRWWLVLVCRGCFGSLSLSFGGSGAPCECLRVLDRSREGVSYWTAPPFMIAIIVFLGGLSTKRCPGWSVLNGLCSPHLLPQSPKVGAGRGDGGAGRTVMQMLYWHGEPYCDCHANACLLCPVTRGEVLSVFFFFRLWLGVFCQFFAVFLFLGLLFGINFRERTSVFGHRCWSCTFRWCSA